MSADTETVPMADLGSCPVCGARSLGPAVQIGSLLAVCDVLVVKTLEQIGKRIVRAERSRFRLKGTHPWHEAHTLWPTSEAEVSKALKGAWDVVPALLDGRGCYDVTARQVSEMLDEYIRDLVITGTAHNTRDLEYRFTSRLGLPVITMETVDEHQH